MAEKPIPTNVTESLILSSSDGLNWYPVKSDSEGKIYILNASQLVPKEYDTILVSYNDANFQEIYTYKTGGQSGTTVATVTVTYTDATKSRISSIVRT